MESPDFLYNLMMTRPEYFEDVLNNSEKYRLQIIYTQIDRDSTGFAHFTDYTYRLDTTEYYYVASMVKLPLIAMTLEKLNQIDSIDKNTRVTFDACTCIKALSNDTTSKSDLVTFAHIIKKGLVLSDNDAFNRLYDFLGQEQCNKRLWQLGFTSARIIKRFSDCSTVQNRQTCPVNFYDSAGNLIYRQNSIFTDTAILGWFQNAKIGKGVFDDNTGEIVPCPKDFNLMNYMSINDLHKIVEMIFFPDVFKDNEKFNLSEDDYNLIRKYMGMYPRESEHPYYLPYEKYYDSYVKYYLLGNSTEKVPENIRIFDKVGMSYGFMTDVAYIVDYEHNVEFLLSALIYTNENGIINDGIYEYRQIALPFFEQLGFLILDYEINREKKYLPELIKFDYSNGN
jgi:hypothetical protein